MTLQGILVEKVITSKFEIKGTTSFKVTGNIIPGLRKIIWLIGVLRRTIVKVTDVSTTYVEATFRVNNYYNIILL